MSVSLEQLIKWRREFHQYPEIGWSEFLTTAKIVKVLRGLGLEVKVGPEVINQDFAFGRRRQVVEKGLAVARKHHVDEALLDDCLLYTSPSPRDLSTSRMPSSA